MKHLLLLSASVADLRTATLTYDGSGNRTSQKFSTLDSQPSTAESTYTWTAENRLASVTLPDGSTHSYAYDYRVRHITRSEPGNTTAMTYSGGLSVAEYAVADASSSIPPQATSVVEYQRGPDMGGGVGGLPPLSLTSWPGITSHNQSSCSSLSSSITHAVTHLARKTRFWDRF